MRSVNPPVTIEASNADRFIELLNEMYETISKKPSEYQLQFRLKRYNIVINICSKEDNRRKKKIVIQGETSKYQETIVKDIIGLNNEANTDLLWS